MNNFCPIIKEGCKGSNCISWKDDKCLIFFFLETSTRYSTVSTDDDIDDNEFEFEDDKPQKAPPEIEAATPEQLANDIVSFTKKEFAGEEMIWVSQSARFFWDSKGINRYALSAEDNLKIEKAERLAQQQLNAEREIETQKKLEIERAELPQLVEKCTQWAKERGITKLVLADVDTFLLEKSIQVLQPTRRAIYATTNTNLKSGKK
jgi:hypothetical protein